MAEYEDRERFIPFRKSEIVDMLCEDGRLGAEEQDALRAFCKILQSLYHFEFHDKVEGLKDAYYPFNPDKDTKTTRSFPPEALARCEQDLSERFREVLNDANFEQVTQQEIEQALEAESLFHIQLHVDFDDFDDLLIFRRGDVVHKTMVRRMVVLKREIEVPTFERVAVLIKFKHADYFAARKRKNLPFEPGSMVIKLFKNIPKADLEMLFPNCEVRMKVKDQLFMGLPALAGGVGVMLKAGAGLVALVGVLWLLARSFISGEDVSLGSRAGEMIAGLSALGVIGGFLVKQWTKYKSRKILFLKTLSDNLYFKNLDNNAGVFHHIVDSAEEEECKEAILGYYFLLVSRSGHTEAALDDAIEEWFEKKHQTLIDFEVDDALRKLKDLKLCTEEPGEDGHPVYKALTLQQACERLDFIWDNYFQYNV